MIPAEPMDWDDESETYGEHLARLLNERFDSTPRLDRD